MNTISNCVLSLAVATGIWVATAAAQSPSDRSSGGDGQFRNAVLSASPGGFLRQADWDDHRRCDGDHDRDDRGCWDARDRYRAGNGYYGKGFYPGAANGWYDRKGNFYPYGANGYFDKHGKWHNLHGHPDRHPN